MKRIFWIVAIAVLVVVVASVLFFLDSGQVPPTSRVTSLEENHNVYTTSTDDLFQFEKYVADSLITTKAPLVVSIDRLLGEEHALEVLYNLTDVNFAGHYVVVELPCSEGTECQHIVLVDAQTGRTVQSIRYNGYAPMYQRTSRLLVVNGPQTHGLEPAYESIALLMQDGALPYLQEIGRAQAGVYYELTK